METGLRTERRRRDESEADAGRGERRKRDTIVIRLPEIDPNLRDWVLDMIPGRGLLRVLSDLPEGVVTHSRNARRERLLAMRSLLDALIEETEQPSRRRAAQEVEIE